LARRVFAGTKREEGAVSAAWMWNRLVIVDRVVFLLAFCACQRLLAFSNCSAFMLAFALIFSVGVNARQHPLDVI
jgi:hypothetical protein